MFGRVWQKKLAALRALARSILHDGSAVDDALQEAFLRVLQSKTRVANEEDAYRIFRRTVLNTAIDHYRYLQRRKCYCQLDQINTDYCVFVSDSSVNALQQLIQAEKACVRHSMLEEVQAILYALPQEQRQAIELIFGRNGKRMQAVCDEAGIPYSTLRSRMLRGVDQIRKHLRRKGLLQRPDRRCDGAL